MPVNILMPALSPTMEEGTLARWLKAEGDEVRAGEVIAEIETDKATMEVEAVDDGRLARIVVPAGSEGVKINAVIAVLAEEGEDPAAIAAEAPVPAAPTPGPAAPTAAAPAPGSRERAPAPSPPDAVPGLTRDLAAGAPNDRAGRVFASPLARRLATERGIDLSTLTGSGPRGRIVKADVEGAAAAPAASPAPRAVAPSAPVPPPPEDDRVAEEIPLDGMRRTIAERLVEAKTTIPHFYLRRSAGIDTLLQTRARINERMAERGLRLSVNDFIIKAAALALRDLPECNAVWAGDRILRMRHADIAVAVAVEGGLFTPVVRDAEMKPLAAISAEMADLAARARNRRLAPHEYQGGSFSISNLGMFGIESFDAVINPPHAAILAVGAGVERPVVRAGEVAVATVMELTLSADHRVIDGAAGARLLAALTGYLEDPTLMLV